MSTMIRGYGLPSDAAGSYNGYGSYGRARGYGYGRSTNPLFRTLPDPELGHFGAGEVFDDRTGMRIPHITVPGGGVLAMNPVGGGSGLGLGVLALGAAAVLLFLKMR